MQSAHLFFSFYESGNEEIMAFDGVTIACVISELKKTDRRKAVQDRPAGE